MASDAFTLDRLRNFLKIRQVDWQEKRMFGGECFLIDGKMCFGTYKNGLILRVDPASTETLGRREGISPMVQGGREMPGYLLAEPSAYDREEDLAFWIDACLAFNPLAKASKKK